MHRYKYEREVGHIPDGWDIHHIDHDKTNNDIDNLVAIPKAIHAWIFSKEREDIVKETKGTKNWASQNITLINLLPINTTCKVTTRLIDVLEDEVDEKYYLSEEKTKKLTLNEDLSGRLNHYDYRDVDSIHSTEKVSPTLNTMQGGDRQPKIAVVGNTSNTHHEAHNVHDVNGLSPTITRDYKGAKQVAIPVLTPDRVNKRQNGRRFKEDNDPMFTLTSQDRHGIAIREATKKDIQRLWKAIASIQVFLIVKLDVVV